MRKKYFCEEEVFGFVWDSADGEGLWEGTAAIVAAEFHVSEDEAYHVLSELCNRNRVQKIGGSKFAIMNWRDRDELGEEEECY